MTNEERAAKVAALNERLQRPALPVTGVDRGTEGDRQKSAFIRSLTGKDAAEGDGVPDGGQGDGTPGGAEPTVDELKAKLAEQNEVIREQQIQIHDQQQRIEELEQQIAGFSKAEEERNSLISKLAELVD